MSQSEVLSSVKSPCVDDLDFQHLHAELVRIDVLIRRQIYLWQLAGQDVNDAFRGLYVSDKQANSLLDRPLCGSWGNVEILDNMETDGFE